MGAGEYLSSKAHRDYVLTEKRREQWEYKNYKEGEIKEMVLLFTQRGMSSADAELVVPIRRVRAGSIDRPAGPMSRVIY